jgi:glycosyltransferase involved in cell wall biosynthesis
MRGRHALRVAVVANMIDPNRAPVLAKLAARDDVGLLVVYETAMEANRHWQPDHDLPYRNALLRSLSVPLFPLGGDGYIHLPWRPLAALRAFQPDVVVAGGSGIWSSPTNIAALAARRSWSFVPWWGSPRRPLPSKGRQLADPWVRLFVRASDAWIAYGTRAAEEVERLGADGSRIVIVPNVSRPGMPPAPWDPWGEHGPRLLFVGQLIPRKGVDVLLDAFASVPRGTLVVAGDGPLRPLVEAAARRDERITYEGHADWRRLQELYRACDVLVLPSRYEVWGLVVNEALSHGLPVIATDEVGAADDLLEPGVTGAICEAGSAESLTRAMIGIADWSPDRQRRCFERALARMQTWSVEVAAERLLAASVLAAEHRRRVSTTARRGARASAR